MRGDWLERPQIVRMILCIFNKLWQVQILLPRPRKPLIYKPPILTVADNSERRHVVPSRCRRT